ncbi:MAG: enoyl-CoA hydratase [Acidimicrobiia bacterium]|nr:enoyl-CoA hydratase [Acidimicrobiia bacterium]
MGDDRTLETGTEYLLGRVEDGVAVLTFNRPDRRNALHPAMFEAYEQLLPALAEDTTVGALLLTGAGGAFCAGGDVRAMDDRNSGRTKSLAFEERVTDLRRRQRGVSALLFEFPKVTIAAIPGPAAGAGLSIALACDLRVAAERAVITTAFAKVGFSGDFGGSWFLTQMLGSAKARELYLTADRLGAAEAERIGILNRVLPDEGFDAAALAYARGFAQGPTVAHRYIKENINRATGADLRTCLDAEAVAMSRTGQTEDHREAARAFVEKRDPVFQGR